MGGRALRARSSSRGCPGDAGPDAIADVLTGAVNPGGKLPVSIPRHVGQVPVTYRHHPTGGHSQPKGDYVDGPVTPLWPFGFGLSYTTFAVDRLRLDRDRGRRPTAARSPISVDVDEHRPRARATRSSSCTSATRRRRSPARSASCAASGGVALEPGECRTVSFRLSTEQFAYVGADYRRVIEPGTIRIHVGTSSASLPLSATLTVTGPDVHLVDRCRFLTETTVE